MSLTTSLYGPRGAPLRAFPIHAAQLASTPSSTTATKFTYPGTSPAVSANGTSNAIVWAHENTNAAVLHAYEATHLAHELYNSSQAAGGRDPFGAGNKFITPMVTDGKVFVGTTNGGGTSSHHDLWLGVGLPRCFDPTLSRAETTPCVGSRTLHCRQSR